MVAFSLVNLQRWKSHGQLFCSVYSRFQNGWPNGKIYGNYKSQKVKLMTNGVTSCRHVSVIVLSVSLVTIYNRRTLHNDVTSFAY